MWPFLCPTVVGAAHADQHRFRHAQSAWGPVVDVVNERGAACARARVESTARRPSFIIHHQHQFSPHSPQFGNAFRMGLAVGTRCPPRGRAQVTSMSDFSRAIGEKRVKAASAGSGGVSQKYLLMQYSEPAM